MKPRFLEVIRLGVLLAFVAVAVAFLVGSYSHVDSAVNAAAGVHASEGGLRMTVTAADGVSAVERPVGSIFSTGLFMVKLFFYAVIATTFCCALVLLLKALGIATDITGKLASGIAAVFVRVKRQVTPLPMLLDTVIDTSKSGEPVTLGQVLIGMRNNIRELRLKTAGLELPPPPKSAEEVAAEKDAQLEAMAAELAAMREALTRQSVAAAKPTVQPAPNPKAPVEGGAQ